MKRRKTLGIFAACMGIFFMTGCGGEQQKIFSQAEADLEQGNYEAAYEGFSAAAEQGHKTAQSLRGAGIAALHMGNWQEAIDNFTGVLEGDEGGKSLKQDVLSYRATAELKGGFLDDAMADCQTLAEDYSMSADTYYLTGCVALAMDSYDEASSNFEKAYAEDSDYEMAISICEAYLNQDMEADGTRYLEAVLASGPKNAEDHCARGRIYYYMQDYENAHSELSDAMEQGSTEAKLLTGMVYLAQEDTENARAMYQDYLDSEDCVPAKGYNGLVLCDLADGNYDSALGNIAAGLENASGEDMQNLLFNEIAVYERQLDFATALTKAQTYTELYPDDEAAARELVFLQSRVG